MYQSIPIVMRTSPVARIGFTPTFVTSACARARRQDGGARSRQEREAGFQRRIAEHLLHVERQEEEVREHDRAEDEPDDVRAGHRAHVGRT